MYKTFLKIKLASRRTEKNTIKIVEEERFCSFFLIGSLVKPKFKHRNNRMDWTLRFSDQLFAINISLRAEIKIN